MLNVGLWQKSVPSSLLLIFQLRLTIFKSNFILYFVVISPIQPITAYFVFLCQNLRTLCNVQHNSLVTLMNMKMFADIATKICICVGDKTRIQTL